MAVWAEQLMGQPWVTDAIFNRARNLILTQHDDKYLPPFKVVLDYCHEAKAQLEREATHQAQLAVALPSPAYRDDQSTTPDERQRWALEDADIRPWFAAVLRRRQEVAYLDERLDPETLRWQRDIEAIEDGKGRVPDMTPDARRARDRRNEGAKTAAHFTTKATEDVGVWPR